MKRWRLVIIILSVTFLFFLASMFGGLKYPKDALWFVLKPVAIGFEYSFGKVPSFFKNIFQINIILRQNKDLVAENLNLQSQMAKYAEIQYENEVLKKELNFSQTQEKKDQLIPAAIIGRTSGFLESMTVDKGEKDGLVKGQAVVSQGFIVGIVNSVTSSTSDITLITNYNSLVPVILENSRGTGLLRGGLQGLVVEDIPLNVQIQPGETIITSGLGGQIPSGIAVGKAMAVVSKQGEIFQKITVNSPIDFSKLEVLFIVRNND